MNQLELTRPNQLHYDQESLTDYYGKFWAEPFTRGFGTTIGNSLRRVLLSSLMGTAITEVRIEGVLHEFTSVPGVIEDVTDIVLNLKRLLVRLKVDHSKTIFLQASGEGPVTAGQIQTDEDIEILNPDLHIATLDKGAEIKLEMKVEWGRGYMTAEQRERDEKEVGVILTDAIFSPIRKVNYQVEATRHEQAMDYDRLVLEVWTNGTIRPLEAVAHASRVLKEHFEVFSEIYDDGFPTIQKEPERVVEEAEEWDDIFYRSVDQLELSVRSYNCLKNANIKTIADLVQKTEAEMLSFRNFGRKSLLEIKENLQALGLSVGMSHSEIVSFKRPSANVAE